SLCHAAEYHEGEEENARDPEAGCARCRCVSKTEYSEVCGTIQAQGRRESRRPQSADRQAAQRSQGALVSVLVLAEHDNKTLKKATLNALAAAQKIGGDIHVLVAGSGAAEAAKAAAQAAGVKKVLLA